METCRAVGDIRKGKDIGRGGNPNQRYVWHGCAECGRERWVQVKGSKAKDLLCRSCGQRGERSHRWNGGRGRNKGYLLVKLMPNSPYWAMANSKGYVQQHRLVMAESLGRCLARSEKVHHVDGDQGNNAPSNLMLMSQANHNVLNGLCSHCNLRREIRLLRWEVRELKLALQEKLRIGGV